MAFLDAYRKYFLQATDASHEFCEASALAVLSTISLGYRWIDRGPGIRPNLFLMLIAHSSADRKSTSVEFACDMIESVAKKRMGPEDWTGESLSSILRKRPGTTSTNRILLPMPEFGEHLARMKKQYGSDMNAVLCKVYDGKSFKRARSGKKMIDIRNPRVSLFGGVAYAMIEKHGDRIDWETGLYARIMWITPKNQRPKFPTPPQRPESEQKIAREELRQLFATLKNTKGPMRVSKAAEERYTTFAEALPESQPTTAHSAQRERLLNAVWKLGMLYQIDRDPMDALSGPAMDAACAFAMHAWEGFCIAYSVCSDSELDRTMNRLWSRLTDAGEAGLARRELQRATHTALSQFKPAIDLLCALGYVQAHAVGKKPGYKVVVPFEKRAERPT